MIYQLIPLLLLCLHFLLIFTSAINPARRKYTLATLLVFATTLMAINGFVFGNWSLVLAGILVGMISFQEGQEESRKEVISTLFPLALILLAASQVLSTHVNLLLMSFIFISLNVTKDDDFKLSHYLFFIASLTCSIFYLIIDYSAVQWMNPSFILPDTIVSSEVYYLDYATDLRLSVLLYLLLGLVIVREPDSRSNNYLALGCMLVILSTDSLMVQKSYFSLIGFALVSIALLKDVLLISDVRYSVLPSTLMISATIFFMRMLNGASFDALSFATFSLLIISTVYQTFLSKEITQSSFIFVKGLILFLLFTYLSIGSPLKLFALAAAGVCLLDILMTAQRLLVSFYQEGPSR